MSCANGFVEEWGESFLGKNDPTYYHADINGVPFEIWWNQIYMTGQLW